MSATLPIQRSKNHLGEVIYSLCEIRGWGIKDLSEHVPGTTSSTFSKIRSGDFSRICDQRLDQIAEALAPDNPNIRALIVCAYLHDMCPPDYQHLVEIRPRGNDPFGNYEMGIHKTLQQLGAAASKDDAFRAHLRSLVDLADAIIMKAPAEFR